MVKNKAMRLGSILLVCALITTCAIGGTYAKYTTSSSAGTSDSARIAYWGLTTTASADLQLFKTAYDSDTNPTVKSSNDEHVIAPGTKNSVSQAFAYTAKNGVTAPEVAYTFKVDVSTTSATSGDDSVIEKLDNLSTFKWTLQSGTAAKATEYNTWNDFSTALKALSGATTGSKDYAAGQLPAALSGTNGLTIGWVWGFGDGTTDADDTTLGNLGSALTDLEITIDVSATQKD